MVNSEMLSLLSCFWLMAYDSPKAASSGSALARFRCLNWISRSYYSGVYRVGEAFNQKGLFHGPVIFCYPNGREMSWGSCKEGFFDGKSMSWSVEDEIFGEAFIGEACS